MKTIRIEGVGNIGLLSERERHTWYSHDLNDIDFVMFDRDISTQSPVFSIGVSMPTYTAILRLAELNVVSSSIFVTNARTRALQSFALFTNDEDATMFKLMI